MTFALEKKEIYHLSQQSLLTQKGLIQFVLIDRWTFNGNYFNVSMLAMNKAVLAKKVLLCC